MSTGPGWSASSIVRAMSTGGDGTPAPPRADRQQLTDAEHAHLAAGSEEALRVLARRVAQQAP